MSSSTVSHDQAMKDQIESMEANLKCPVCLLIPRELPIPCCSNGHIVCRPCREHVTSCPTCRQPMPENMINSVVGALIDQTIKHKCKYNDQGCEVKMMLKDLSAHEKRCPDRTVKCPDESCGLVVKLVDFGYHMKHMEISPCRIPWGEYLMFYINSFEEDRLRRDEILIYGKPYGHEQTYRLEYSIEDKCVYTEVKWHEPMKSFVLWLWMAEDRRCAHKYNAKVTIHGVGENLLTMDRLRISSVENLPLIDECEGDDGEYFLCIPKAMAKKMSKKLPDSKTLWKMRFDIEIQRSGL